MADSIKGLYIHDTIMETITKLNNQTSGRDKLARLVASLQSNI